MSGYEKLVLYGTSWCGGSRRARLLLEKHGIPFEWVDIDQDEEAGKLVERLNRGFRSVPTLVWPDGTQLTEPSEKQLIEKLGVGSQEVEARKESSPDVPAAHQNKRFFFFGKKRE
jgi:mycoredoxin